MEDQGRNKIDIHNSGPKEIPGKKALLARSWSDIPSKSTSERLENIISPLLGNGRYLVITSLIPTVDSDITLTPC